MNTAILAFVVTLVFAVGVAIYLKTQLEGQKTIGRARSAAANEMTVRYDKKVVELNDCEKQLGIGSARYASLESALHREREACVKTIKENESLRIARSNQNRRINELIGILSNSHQRVGKKMLKLGMNPDGTLVSEQKA